MSILVTLLIVSQFFFIRFLCQYLHDSLFIDVFICIRLFLLFSNDFGRFIANNFAESITLARISRFVCSHPRLDFDDKSVNRTEVEILLDSYPWKGSKCNTRLRIHLLFYEFAKTYEFILSQFALIFFIPLSFCYYLLKFYDLWIIFVRYIGDTIKLICYEKIMTRK